MTIDEIPPHDLKIETVRKTPYGGQHVGIDSAVRVTHTPTGTIAESYLGRSQWINRKIALDMILAALTHPDS